jgi:hypothetical protein
VVDAPRIDDPDRAPIAYRHAMDARFPLATVTCVRCQSAVPEREADFSADGMLCRTCVLGADIASRLGVATVGADVIAEAERGFARSTAIKHLTIGFIGLAGGLVLLAIFVWMMSQGRVSRGIILPLVILVGSVTELARGLAAWSSYKSMGSGPTRRM